MLHLIQGFLLGALLLLLIWTRDMRKERKRTEKINERLKVLVEQVQNLRGDEKPLTPYPFGSDN